MSKRTAPGSEAGAPARTGSDRAIVVAFYALASAVAATWLYVIPYDATDLSYLLSLEDHAWVPQELVHPLWLPLLWAYRAALRGVGFHGFMLVPIEAANVMVSFGTALVVFHFARRRTRDSIAAAGAALLLMSTSGFGSAAVRPTPYALAFACVLGALLLLTGEHQASRSRALAAGAIGGVAMALHASAMALVPMAILCALTDPERRSWRDTALRAVWFTLAVVLVFGVSWAGWFVFNGLDRSFFDLARLRSLFGAVEQVPGTSIYSSHSPRQQIVGLYRTLSQQGGLLVPLGAVAVLVEAWRLRAPKETPAEYRLTIATVACLGGIGGFFLINNYRNGFNFAAFALVPLLIAQAAARVRWARPALLATCLLAAGVAMHDAVAAGHNRFHEILPKEVAFVASALGPGGVLLVPGCAFDELRLLSSIAVLRVRTPGDDGRSCALPSAEPGPALRARVRGWRDRGRRVLFAYGDEEHDFSGDANGMEKDVQLFWSPDLSATQRAPKLEAARAALSAAGLRLQDGVVSPRGARYGDVVVDSAGDPSAPPRMRFAPADLGLTDARDRVIASAMQRFHALVPDDPWAPCDPLCAGLAVLDGAGPQESDPLLACGCPGSTESPARGRSPACWFGPPDTSDHVHAYVDGWAEHAGLETPLDWSASLDRARAEVALKLRGGTLRIGWRLEASCEVTSVEVHADSAPVTALATPDKVDDFVAHFPAPKARELSRR